MSRRIDVELTSARDDGTYTWRAAGAKQPKGLLDAGLLYPGAKVGDVVRAEADFEIEGITITSILPPKEKKKGEIPGRLEIIGSGQAQGVAGVTSSLVPKSERPPRERRDRPFGDGDGDQRGRPPAGAGGRPTGPGGPRGGSERGSHSARERPPRPAADRGPRPAGESGPRTGRNERPDPGPRSDRAGRPGRVEHADGPVRPARTDRPGRPERAPRSAPATAPVAADKPKPKRLLPGSVYRDAALAALPPEQRPVAEQVLRGGIPAVRQAVAAQNASRPEGTPELRTDLLVAMAEGILSQLKEAEWRDRAEAAAGIVDDIGLRDLRSVVTAGESAARDEEARSLATTLREALERRLSAMRDEWVAEIGHSLDEGRLVRALRTSSRPPDPGTRMSAELALRLAEAASRAMSPDVQADRWAALLEAVLDSPVRRSVKPVGLPAEPGDALLLTARQASGRVPALAGLLGIDMPPPPGPARPGVGRHRPGRPPRDAQPSSAPRRPPPPPRSAVAPPAVVDGPAPAAPAPAPAPEASAPRASDAAPEAPAAEAAVSPAREEGPPAGSVAPDEALAAVPVEESTRA
jgi:hypothetical protein